MRYGIIEKQLWWYLLPFPSLPTPLFLSYFLPLSAKCRLQIADCKQGTKCRLQTADWVQNADWESKLFFHRIHNNKQSYNLPSVTQSLFCDHRSRWFALLWNIPCLFLDHNRSWYNVKPSYSLLTLRASWLVWSLYRFYQLNKSRCRYRCKWDSSIEYLTPAIFEKKLRALHVVRTF